MKLIVLGLSFASLSAFANAKIPFCSEGYVEARAQLGKSVLKMIKDKDKLTSEKFNLQMMGLDNQVGSFRSLYGDINCQVEGKAYHNRKFLGKIYALMSTRDLLIFKEASEGFEFKSVYLRENSQRSPANRLRENYRLPGGIKGRS